MKIFIKHLSLVACVAMLLTPASQMRADYRGYEESALLDDSEAFALSEAGQVESSIETHQPFYAPVQRPYMNQQQELHYGRNESAMSEYRERDPSCEQNASRTFDIVAEVLYWRPTLCGLEGAFGDTSISTYNSSISSTSSASSSIAITNIVESDKRPTSNWDAGFRVGAALGHCGCDAGIEWTHFDGKSHFSHHDHDQHGEWKIKYDSIDLKWGHYFSVTPCLSFSPFIGIRGLKIEQKLNSHLQSTLVTSLENTMIITDQHEKETFNGLGPELGLYVDCKVGASVNIFGQFEVVGYYGKVHGKNQNTDNFQSRITNTYKKTCRNFNTVGTDAKLGMRWDKISYCSCNGERRFSLSLGVEQHRIYDFSNMGSDGNLSLDGGFFALSFALRY